MFHQLPTDLSGDQVYRAFIRAGWHERYSGGGKGSHRWALKKDGCFALLTIQSRRNYPRGSLMQLIKAAGMTVEEFLGLI